VIRRESSSGNLRARVAIEKPEIGQKIDADQIENLPSVTRSTTKYALLNPHVRQVLGLGADFTDASRLSINAGSYRHTGYMLDGAPTYDYIYANSPQVAVSPGAVREINVLTGQYSAQYGLSTTGVVSITTPSGTDRLKGEAFTHIRPSATQERPPLATFDVPNERSDWGFFAGGPLGRARTRQQHLRRGAGAAGDVPRAGGRHHQRRPVTADPVRVQGVVLTVCLR